MKKTRTHSANVYLGASGKTRHVKCYESVSTWVVGPNEMYYKNTGLRVGNSKSTRMLLDTLAPIGGEHV